MDDHLFFRADAYAPSLASGSSHETFGLNLQVLSNPVCSLGSAESAAFATEYKKAQTCMAACTGAERGLWYESRYLHVTVASPVVFTSGTDAFKSQKDRIAVEAAIAAALTQECIPKNNFPLEPFPLTYECVQASPSAAFLRLKDPTGGVDRIRGCVRRLEGHKRLRDLGVLDPLRGGFKIPGDGFVHSTIWRPMANSGALPVVGVDDEDRDRAALVATEFTSTANRCMNAAAAAWDPVSVTVDRVRLVRESRAYMHLSQFGEGGCAAEEATAWETRMEGRMEGRACDRSGDVPASGGGGRSDASDDETAD